MTTTTTECREWCAVEGPHEFCERAEVISDREAHGPCPSWCSGSHCAGQMFHRGGGMRVSLKAEPLLPDGRGRPGRVAPHILINAFHQSDSEACVSIEVSRGHRTMTATEARKVAKAILAAVDEAAGP